MKDLLKKLKRCVAVCICVALFMTTNQVASAQEITDNDIMQEYLDKLATGAEVYLLVDEEGVVLGYYESYGEGDVNAVMSRYGATIEWTIGAKQNAYGANIFNMGAGKEINFLIGVSQEGTSYLGLYNRDTKRTLVFKDTESTNGWDGRIILSSAVPTASYSISIINESDHEITYIGSYSL